MTESVGLLVLILKLPSKSVVAPIEVPLKITLAKGIGSPEPASVTFPEIIVSCPITKFTKKRKEDIVKRTFLRTKAPFRKSINRKCKELMETRHLDFRCEINQKNFRVIRLLRALCSPNAAAQF